jgi:hypothetical protein
MDYLPGSLNKSEKSIAYIKNYILEKVKEHKALLDVNNPHDFIDCFLIKIEQVKYLYHLRYLIAYAFCDSCTSSVLRRVI